MRLIAGSAHIDIRLISSSSSSSQSSCRTMKKSTSLFKSFESPPSCV